MTDLIHLETPMPVRDAATLIFLRQQGDERRVLMGQRGRSAVFMPGKFVFPGGGVDPQDYEMDTLKSAGDTCLRRLEYEASSDLAMAVLAAARREVLEETGLALQETAQMHFIFRAVTPPKRTRRFDARFLVCDANKIEGNPDDFSRAEDELSHLQWVSLDRAMLLDLPFVTRIVLGEVQAMSAQISAPEAVPFYDHRGPIGRIRSIR